MSTEDNIRKTAEEDYESWMISGVSPAFRIRFARENADRFALALILGKSIDVRNYSAARRVYFEAMHELAAKVGDADFLNYTHLLIR